jgi:UPF0755 protein
MHSFIITNYTTDSSFAMRKNIVPILLAVLLIGGYFAWKPLKAIYLSGVPSELSDRFVYIPTGASFDEVVDILKRGGFIRDEPGFRWLAKEMNYIKPEMRSGRFEIEPGWNTRELIQHLRAGKQAPVKVVINSERLPEDVAGVVGDFLEADSMDFVSAFRDPGLMAETGYSPETFISMFIPNTYEMYWNTTPKEFVQRMAKENKAFWQKNGRMEKARAQGLTPEQAYTVASIVERESNHNPERPTIAGVYLNRLKINMKLQADPTCVFATRDFGTRRVTQYHTTFDSPYNTYKYAGLPPGPISMASIPSLDAVLDPERHNYLYFCAKPDESGTHAFAATLSGHNVNVEKFRIWMRNKGM